MRISRSFTVPAGAYDVYRRRQGADARQGAEERAAAEGVGDQADGHGARLLERRADHQLGDHRAADRSAARAAHAAAAGRPSVRARHDGNRADVRDTKFTKKSELSTFMLIYNPKVDSDNKPDVSVELQLLPGSSWTSRSGERSRREVLQQDQSAEPERADAAAAIRPRGRPSAAERAGGAAGVVPRRAITGSRSRSPTRSRTRR